MVDTASSNGTFVNNIRLSKCGEESKLTEVFTGDNLRFGSDVVDKSKNVTQKCVVTKLTLYFPDGLEYDSRPVSSRLFRPDSKEDVKNGGDNAAGGGNELEKVLKEKKELCKRLADIENKLADREVFCSSVAMKQERDATEIAKLRLLVDTQNNDIANLEAALNDTQNELERTQADTSADTENERRIQNIKLHYEDQIKELENFYVSEESKMKQKLEDATINESNLLDRIKTLESETGYAQAEVEKIVVKESCEFEYKQVNRHLSK